MASKQPTKYTPNKAQKCEWNGAKFDSKLEKKFAMFFEVCGFEWTREPFQLPNWIPDFLVKIEGIPYLIEVKPEMSFFDISKVEIALKRGFAVVLLANNPMNAITLNWKGNPISFRDALPENVYEIWESVGMM